MIEEASAGSPPEFCGLTQQSCYDQIHTSQTVHTHGQLPAALFRSGHTFFQWVLVLLM